MTTMDGSNMHCTLGSTPVPQDSSYAASDRDQLALEEDQPVSESEEEHISNLWLSDNENSTTITTDLLIEAYLQEWGRGTPLWQTKETGNVTAEVYLLNHFFEAHRECEAEGSCLMKSKHIRWKRRTRIAGHEKSGHDELQSFFKDNSRFKVIVVANICPHAICALGCRFNIPSEFWGGYLGGTETSKTESVDPWLKLLPSLRSPVSTNSVHFQGIEAREISSESHMENPGWIHVDMIGSDSHPLAFPTRASIASQKITILPPRQRKDKAENWPPVAFMHHSVSIWWTRKSKTSRVIIVDAPNEFPDSVKSVYPSATSLPNFYLDGDAAAARFSYGSLPTVQPLLERISAAVGELECDSHDSNLREIRKLLAHQWTLVHAYISRDLHAIQHMVEQDIPDFKLLQRLLKDLFYHRQHCIEYTEMIEQTSGLPDEDLKHLISIFQELLDTIEKQVHLLTTLVSLGETQQSIEESQGVGRLTRIATIYLPFTTVATVLAMPEKFAPGASHFWVYWVASTILAALVIVLLPFYEWIRPRIIEKRWGLNSVLGTGQAERHNEKLERDGEPRKDEGDVQSMEENAFDRIFARRREGQKEDSKFLV